MIELGKPLDRKALLRIEHEAFESDRISNESFWKFLKNNGETFSLLVNRSDTLGILDGYILVLYSKQNMIARIHSYAVSRPAQGKGLGAQLIEAGCGAAFDHSKNLIRTEVRADNPHALARYEKSGFRRCGSKSNYYSDGCAAFSYERALI